MAQPVRLETIDHDSAMDEAANAVRVVSSFSKDGFGQPVLRHANNGRSGWVKDTGSAEALHQKGASGYLANLYVGEQSDTAAGTHWAAVYIPVNELLTSDFTSAQWTYRLTNGEVYGVNMVIWMHDPTDNTKRVEVTQAPSHADLAKADGWNGHILNTATAQFFYYGENVSGSDLSSGTQYTWAQYQADALFKDWTIYRISLEWGWYSTSVFEDAWVADVKLNGQVILMTPPPGEIIGRETKSFFKATVSNSGTDVTLVSPAATKRIQVLSLNMITGNATPADFECYFSVADAMPAAKVIAVRNLATGAVNEHFVNFGDNGPKGEIGEIVSMRTSVNISADGTYTIIYREV